MAEGTSEDSGSWESWLGGWVQAAKDKSNTAYEFVKKDLAEFSTTIQKETEKAIEKTSSSLTRENTEQATTKVKAGISSFLSNVSKALVIPPSDDYVPVKVSADGSTLYDRGKARLHAIQMDASTYVDPPRGSFEQFEMWLNSFDMDQHKGEISEILVSKVEVRALYTKLVPNDVSHAEFWQRYFYRVHQMECDEARKQALMQRADRQHGDSLSWDEDDWSGGEEDEGHESDWEKMPRPQHQESSNHPSLQNEKLSTPSLPPSHDTQNPEQCNPPVVPLTQNPPDNENKDTISESDHQSVSLQVSAPPDSGDQKSASVPTDKKPSDIGLKAVHNHFSAVSSGSHPHSEASATEVSPVSQQEVSADTASACKSLADQVFSPQDAEGPEPGSPAEIPGVPGIEHDSRDSIPHSGDDSPSASSAAAAAGVELSEENSVLGDAACGASDVLPSPSSSSKIIHENSNSTGLMPEASPASNIIPNKETSTPEKKESASSNEESGATFTQAEPSIEPSDAKAVQDENATDLAMKVKGDMVVVGDTPSSDSSEAKGLDDDWEEDFDVEVTEEDLKAAEDIARRLGENLDAEDDWENWD